MIACWAPTPWKIKKGPSGSSHFYVLLLSKKYVLKHVETTNQSK